MVKEKVTKRSSMRRESVMGKSPAKRRKSSDEKTADVGIQTSFSCWCKKLDRKIKEEDETEDISVETQRVRTERKRKSGIIVGSESMSHQDIAVDWLLTEYEISPSNCVLRTSVYDHYTDFCSIYEAKPLSQAMFSKMVVNQAFPRIAMRRLGSRGNSKYYYMGIDIKDESTHFEQIRAESIASPCGKPKTNRSY